MEQQFKKRICTQELWFACCFCLLVYICMWFHFDSHKYVTNLHYQRNQVKVIANQVSFLQTIKMKLILLCVWAEQVVLASAKTALKFKY